MHPDIINKSKDTARFYFSCYKFFRDLELLIIEVSHDLSICGFKVRPLTYGLTYGAIARGRAGSGYNLPTEFFGLCYEDTTTDYSKVSTHYAYGILLQQKNPDSEIEPWSPVLYFMKGVPCSPSDWNYWEYNQKVFELAFPKGGSTEGDQLVRATFPAGSPLYGKLDHAWCVAVPLGAVATSEDIALITLPIITALKHEDPTHLEPLKEILLRAEQRLQNVINVSS